jgi:hypothetical protein
VASRSSDGICLLFHRRVARPGEEFVEPVQS